MIFGKNVEWHSFEQGGGLEALCKFPIPGDIPLFAHVWVQAPNDAQLGALKQASESMKLVDWSMSKSLHRDRLAHQRSCPSTST